MSEDQKINNIEKDMIELRSSVAYQSQILAEVKQILHDHKNILQNITLIQEYVNSLKGDVDRLEKIFESRKEVTDGNNKNFSDFVSKTKGVVAACVVFFGIIQGGVAFVLADNYDNHKQFQKEIQELRIENAVIKNNIRIYNMDKTVQKAVESVNQP